MRRALAALRRAVLTWTRRAFVLVFLVIAAVAAYVSLFALVGGTSAEYPPGGLPRGAVLGAYHVHSTASDGRGTHQEIAEAASRAGLGFVILTDHNPEQQHPPRFEQGVLLIHGAELSTPWGHLVALGLPRALTPEERDRDPVGTVGELGGFSVLAHPIQRKGPWLDWEAARGARGLELYSGDTMLREAQRRPFSRLLPAAGAYVTNVTHGLFSLIHEQPEATRRLLELSAEAPKLALCALDAHGWPGYEEVFSLMALHVPVEALGSRALERDPLRAAAAVLGALSRGDAYCVFRGNGEASGFELRGLGPGRRAQVGVPLRVLLPPDAPASVRLRVQGPVRVVPGGRELIPEGPGAAQIEVWRRAPGRLLGAEWKPWIVPGPILIEEAR